MALRSFSKIYNIIPPWGEAMYRDKFDYKLRTIEQVKHEYETNPPKLEADVRLVEYANYEDHPKSAVVKVILDMEDWNLTKLQRERLIFLLGPRYTGSPKFKVVAKYFGTKEENLEKAFEIINELYLETKRAP